MLKDLLIALVLLVGAGVFIGVPVALTLEKRKGK